MFSHRSFPFGLIALVLLGAVLVVGVAAKGQFKDIFVSVTNSTPSPKPSNASSIPSPTAVVKNEAEDTKTLGESTEKPKASGTKQNGTSSTKVTVNGKDIPADKNGNVEYHESPDGSNVDVSIKNSSQRSSTTRSMVENKVNVHVNTGN